MQKLVAFVATVAVVCVALVQGQLTTVTLAVLSPPDYTVPAAQASCGELGTLFTSTWASTTNTCGNQAAADALWPAYVGGASLTGFTSLATTANKQACDAAAALLTVGSLRDDGVEMCTFVESVVAACSCTRMGCVTGIVNNAVTTAACNPFAQGTCQFFAGLGATNTNSIQARCTAAMTANIAGAGTYTPSAAGVPAAACPASTCPAGSFGVTTTGPPGPTNTGRAPTTTRTGGAAGVSSGVYLAAVALGAAAVL